MPVEYWVMRVIVQLPSTLVERTRVLRKFVGAINREEYLLLGNHVLLPVEGYPTELEAKERATLEDMRALFRANVPGFPDHAHRVILNADF